MLLQLLDYVRREKVVSTQQMVREFKIEPTALQPMLDIWVNKGRIEACIAQSGCAKKCFKCNQGAPVFYQMCS